MKYRDIKKNRKIILWIFLLQVFNNKAVKKEAKQRSLQNRKKVVITK